MIRADDGGQVSLAPLSDEARRRMLFLLRDERISYDANHEILFFSERDRLLVQAALDEAADVDPVFSGLAARRDRHASSVAPFELASRWRRVVGALIDAWVIWLLSVLLLSTVAAGVGWIAAIAAEWVVVVAPIAIWGRSPGALTTGIAVVVGECQDVPGWRASAVRWLVARGTVIAILPALVIGLPDRVLAVLGALQLVVFIAVYAGVFLDPTRRGLHDLAAGTLVVRTPRRERSTQ